jgi:Ca2+-binding EF-hand superfamily protein
MPRSLYLWLIRMHPFGFRQRFAEEMLAIFDEVSGLRAVTALFADVFVSLFRQWVFRSEFRQPMMPEPVSDVAPIFRSLDTYRPRPMALLNGGFISVAAICAVVVAMDHGGSRRAFLIGVHHPSPHLLPVDRSFLAENELNTAVKLGPEPVDPWHAIASIYFKLVRVLGALDADQDLTISRWEIVTAPGALRRLDIDHDGKLNPEECGFSMGAGSEVVADSQFVRRARFEFMRANPVLAALDANHDGEISETEISNSAAALKKLDKNGDGILTPDEVIPDALPVRAAMIFFRLDTNQDGKISSVERASEEAEPLGDILESADRNRDGAITAEELTKELRVREERRRQFENALRGAGLGRSGSGSARSQ